MAVLAVRGAAVEERHGAAVLQGHHAREGHHAPERRAQRRQLAPASSVVLADDGRHRVGEPLAVISQIGGEDEEPRRAVGADDAVDARAVPVVRHAWRQQAILARPGASAVLRARQLTRMAAMRRAPDAEHRLRPRQLHGRRMPLVQLGGARRDHRVLAEVPRQVNEIRTSVTAPDTAGQD